MDPAYGDDHLGEGYPEDPFRNKGTDPVLSVKGWVEKALAGAWISSSARPRLPPKRF
jgi:hypothetical protein